MKTLKLGLSIIFMMSISIFSFGQEIKMQTVDYKTMNPVDWPAELDAVTAAGKSHKVLLENDKVRVLEVTLASNETGILHHHRWPSVIYVLERGHFIDFDGKGKVILDSRKFPEPPTINHF